MTKLRRLIDEAKKGCQFCGHKMKRFSIPYNGSLVKIAYSECKVCGKQVICNAKPEPNDIDIGGEAVALYCQDECTGCQKQGKNTCPAQYSRCYERK